MKKYLFTISCLLAMAGSAFSQCNIYFFTGNVEVLSKVKGTFALTKINEAIAENDALKLAENAEVILKDASGHFAIIHSVGVFNAEKIKEEFKKQQGKSLVTSLADFLGTEITKNHVDIRKTAESYMKQKGGVTRGGSVYPLMVWPAYGSINESSDVKFIWNSVAKVDSYAVVIFGGEDANNPVQLGRAITADTFMDVNFKDFGLTKDAYFSWVAYPKNDPNHSRYTFKIITPEELALLMQEVEANTEKGGSPQEKLLIKASDFEKRGLIALAEKTYKELLAMGKNETFNDLYLLFRLRNNLIQ